MLGSLVKSVAGSRNERLVKGFRKRVAHINALEEAFHALSDEALYAKTAEFRERLGNGEKLDQLLPEAFAAVREAAVRHLGQRHYDVQLVGGMVLHRSEEHTSELQSRGHLVCRLLLEKKKK